MSETPQPGYPAELAALGGYFALDTAADSRSRCIPDLFAEEVISGYVERTRAAVAGAADCAPELIPVRMAASSFQLGVAARLLSPAVGAALCFGAMPVLDGRSLRWLPADGHAAQFIVPDPTWVTVEAATSAQVIADTVLPVLTELGTVLNHLVALSPRITLGNLASAANGAVTVLAMSHPQLEVPGRELVRALLRIEPLTSTGEFVDGTFRRRSCCLYYQAPRSGLCGDCVLVPSAAR